MSTATNVRDSTIRVISDSAIDTSMPQWQQFAASLPAGPIGADPRWLLVLRDGLGHVPYCIEERHGERLTGILPLALVKGPIFGRFLVSLPFVSCCGPLVEPDADMAPLINRAVLLADELRVKQLELRLKQAVEHAQLQPSQTSKVLMKRPLPKTSDELWKALDAKVRNQVRKGEKQALTVQWGREDQQESFYRIFSRNMRDLGTPVFGRRFFSSILKHFGDDAEICVIKLNEQPVAAALLLHGRGITKVPCASSLREYNATNANMFMYWQLLQRAVERGQSTFDFGRSTPDSGTERFKAQWGAEPAPAVWQSYYRHSKRPDLRKESPAFAALTQIWRRLPLRFAEAIGPAIVRGIP